MKKEEYQIIEECKQGSRSAFKYIFDTYSKKMLAIASRYTVDLGLAEDILQESFIKVFQTINKYESKGSFEGWLRRIVVNTALNHYTKKKTRGSEYSTDELEVVEDVSMNIDAQMNGKELLEIIQQLPDGYRMVFNLNVIEGYTHKEIADKLGITEGTSKSQLAKAKRVLRKILEKYKLVA